MEDMKDRRRASTNDESPEVGESIRTLRQQRGLSLRALAQASGLSVNAISLIERGTSSPTVSSLHRLAMALGLPIVALLGQTDEQTVVLVRSGHGRTTRAGESLLTNLAWGLPGQRLQPFLVDLEPGAGSGKELIAHAGQELVYVLAGTVRYTVGSDIHTLGVGDTLLFEASAPHRWTCGSGQRAQFLLVMEAPQDGAVIVAQHLS
jgi:transcriptional regulator with XRE-family HTH domain